MQKLENWRIPSSLIKFPKHAREFHGGHATVSKALLAGNNSEGYILRRRHNPDEVLQSDGQSSGSGGHIEEAADRRRDDKGELGEEEDHEQEYESGSDSVSGAKVGHNQFVCWFRTAIERTSV